MTAHQHSSVVLLSYAKPPRWRLFRRVLRMTMWLILLTIAACAFHWRATIWADAKFWYVQQSCLSYTAPADQVVGVYAEKPVATAQKRDGEYICEKYPRGIFERRTSPAWDRYCTVVSGIPVPPPKIMPPSGPFPMTAGHLDLDKYIVIDSAVPMQCGPAFIFAAHETTAFMHERTSAKGEQKLVAVNLSMQDDASDFAWFLTAGVSPIHRRPDGQQSDWAGGLAIRGRIPPGYPSSPWQRVRSACFFAGQVDPTDASRFTIAYELDGARGTIDCRLLDGGQVKFTVRNGPASADGRSAVVDCTPAIGF